jgi:hypothetical protein
MKYTYLKLQLTSKKVLSIGRTKLLKNKVQYPTESSIKFTRKLMTFHEVPEIRSEENEQKSRATRIVALTCKITLTTFRQMICMSGK